MLLSLLAQATDKTFWMPQRASTYSGDTDWTFYLVYWICVIFTCLIGFCLVYFTIRFRHRGDNQQAAPPHHTGHSTTLELTWTIIPTILVLIIFYYGFRAYLKQSVTPPDAYEIQVSASKWNWAFQYDDGYVGPELHIPVSTPVRLVLSSDDVIHSFFVPAFRAKRDVVPGRFNKVWFQSDLPGTYQGYCAEYCGRDHSQMIFTVVVHPVSQSEADALEMPSWRDWMESSRNPLEQYENPALYGEALYNTRGCAQCHSIDGTPNIGPTWLNMFGSERTFQDGSTAIADENYVVESIDYPTTKIVAGFSGTMPAGAGKYRMREYEGFIAYMKTLSEHYQGDRIQWQAAEEDAGGDATEGAAPVAPATDEPGQPAVPPVGATAQPRGEDDEPIEVPPPPGEQN